MSYLSPLLSPLGWYWVIVPLIVAVIGVLMLLAALGDLGRGEPGRAFARVLFGGGLLVVGVAAGLIALNTQTFVRLTHESAVAEVSVAAGDPAQGRYLVTVRRLDGANLAKRCDLQGDEWSMSARVQKWKPWANVLGLDSTYALDQIGNKYFTAARGNGHVITACDLAGPVPTVNAYVPPAWLAWLVNRTYAEDKRFGSAVYMPLANGAVYRVTMTQSGLNAEAVNPVAQAAVKSGI